MLNTTYNITSYKIVSVIKHICANIEQLAMSWTMIARYFMMAKHEHTLKPPTHEWIGYFFSNMCLWVYIYLYVCLCIIEKTWQNQYSFWGS